MYVYIYIHQSHKNKDTEKKGRCIYCHPQTDCFVVSQLISVARHTKSLKVGSKSRQRDNVTFQPSAVPREMTEFKVCQLIFLVFTFTLTKTKCLSLARHAIYILRKHIYLRYEHFLKPINATNLEELI